MTGRLYSSNTRSSVKRAAKAVFIVKNTFSLCESRPADPIGHTYAAYAAAKVFSSSSNADIIVASMYRAAKIPCANIKVHFASPSHITRQFRPCSASYVMRLFISQTTLKKNFEVCAAEVKTYPFIRSNGDHQLGIPHKRSPVNRYQRAFSPRKDWPPPIG